MATKRRDYYQAGDEGLLTEPSVEEPWQDPELATNEDLAQTYRLPGEPDIEGGRFIEDEYVEDPQFGEVGYPPYAPELAVPSDSAAYKRSKSLFELTNEALQKGDNLLATGYLDEQHYQSQVSQIRVEDAGLDPNMVAPNAAFTDERIEQNRLAVIGMRRAAELREVFTEHDIGGFNTFLSEILEQYKEKNGTEAFRVTDSMSEQELIDYHSSLEPVVVDPGIVAEMRSRLVKLDLAMKQHDPKLSVFTHQDTRIFANWIQREAGPGMGGFLVSGPEMEAREEEVGFFTKGAKAVASMAEGVTDLGLNLLYGAYDLSGRYIESVTMGRVGWAAPTNVIMGPDGKLYTNAGKVPGIIETMVAVRARVMSEDVYDQIGHWNRAREMETMKEGGFDKVVQGISGVYGMAFGFGIPAGAAMRTGAGAANLFGSLTMKGLTRLGAGGTIKGAMNPKALAVTKFLAEKGGSAVGLGLMEATAFGRHEGYGKAFMGGMAMAPVLMVFGAASRGLDKRMLNRRVKGKDGKVSWIPREHMPAAVAHAVSGGLEGVGFGTLQLYQQDMLWDFVTDPTEEHWKIYLENVVGFGLFKMMHARSPFDIPGEAAIRRQAQREMRVKFGQAIGRFRGKQQAEAQEKVEQQEGRAKAAEKGAEFVEAKEGEPMRELERQPSAEKQMEQAVRGELVEPKEVTPEQRAAKIAAKRGAEQGRDPLEEPDFMERPEGERRRILDRRTAKERRQTSEEIDIERRGDERRGDERRGDERREADESRREPTKDDESRRERTEEGQMEQRILEAGVSEELLIELGEVAAKRRQAKTAGEAEQAWKRQQEIERELDVQEAARDPMTAARIRDLEQKGLLEAEEPAGELEARAPVPGPSAGKAPGGSMAKAASPHRQLETTPGTKPIRAVDIHNTFEGRQGVGGIVVLGIPIGRKIGTAVQVAMRSGRIAARKTLGVFKIFENMTRTKAGRDLVVKAHEWSHAMQRQVLFGEKPGGRSFVKAAREWYESLTDVEKADVAKILEFYPGADKLRKWQLGAEAWAEWFARDLLGDATLYAETPALSKKLLTWLGGDQAAHLARGPRSQYRILQQQLMRYNMQGAAGRLDQSIIRGFGEPQGTLYERLTGTGRKALDHFVNALFDDMVALKRSQAKWLKISRVNPADLDIQDNPARMFDTLRMVASKQSENFLLRFTHTLGFRKVGESLKAILNSEGIRKRKREFINYVVAVRSVDLLRKGKTQQLPIEDYLHEIERLSSPEFEEGAKRLKAWSDSLLDLVGEAGNLPQADIQRMKDYSIVYLPFVRALQGPRPSGGGRGVAEKGTGAKRMKGSTYEIKDPVEALEDVTRSMIAKAHQYMVMRALYRMTLKAEAGGLASIVPRKNVPSQFRLDQVFRQMQDAMEKKRPEDMTEEELERWEESFGFLGEMVEAGMSDAMVTLFGQKVLPIGEKDAIIAFTPRLTEAEIAELPKDRQGEAIRNNDKMLWMELDVPAYEALMGIDQPIGPQWINLPIIKQVIGYPVQWTRFFATNANPAFAAANMLRDAMSQPVFDKEGKFAPFAGFYKMFMGAAELMSKGEYAQMYEASGSAVSSFMNEGTRRQMRGEAQNIASQAVQGVRVFLEKWERFVSHPESYLRIYEFKKQHQKAIAEGKTELEASLRALEGAREITVNFARGGILARALNQAIPYFNASFQGHRKMIRSLAGMEGTSDAEKGRIQRAAWVNGLTNITIPTMIIWSLFHDEDWYKDLPEWRKRHYWNMKFPDSETIVSVPKPFELGLLFGTIPEIALDHASDSNPIALAPTIGEMVIPYLRGWSGLIPTTFRAPLEVYTGKDFYTGRELTPYWTKQEKPPEEQVRASTSEFAKMMFNSPLRPLVELAGAENPIELEQLIGGYTAGAGVTALRMIDEVSGLRDHPGILPGVLAPLSSFYNRFARQTPFSSGRTVTEMYELGRELRQRRDTLTGSQRDTLAAIERAGTELSGLNRAATEGTMSREEANRRKFEIANEIMRSVR